MPGAHQFEGCIIGQCIGDFVGFPVEGRGADECGKFVDAVLGGWIPKVGRFGLPFGQYTDDSQLARELMRSFVQISLCRQVGAEVDEIAPGFEARGYALRIGAMFLSGAIIGQGRATANAAERINAGVPWQECGAPAPSAGNGTAMRAAPVGLIWGADTSTMLRVARIQGEITHKDPRCSAGSIAIAAATRAAARDKVIDGEAWIKEVADLAGTEHAQFGRSIAKLAEWRQLEPREAMRHIAVEGSADPDQPYDWPGVSPFVVPSVLWSLYAFVRSPENFEETIRTAIAVGGDVDTTGAMAGAISGAHLGIDGLPRRLAERVTDLGTWEERQVRELARQCAELAGYAG